MWRGGCRGRRCGEEGVEGGVERRVQREEVWRGGCRGSRCGEEGVEGAGVERRVWRGGCRGRRCGEGVE